MEISHQFRATSLSCPSPTSTHIACLNGSRLQIRSTTTLELIRNIPLPSDQNIRTSFIRWSPQPRSSNRSNRVLVADEDNARVFDLRDDKWSAVINNGSGGMGKIVHAEFGRNEEEALLWSDFASRITIWCLRSGRSVEIRDPKFSGKERRGYGYRPGGKDTLAILCRTAGQDILMLLAPGSYSVVRQAMLGTMDAQGVKWSPDGRWIVVWDSPGSGYKVHIYTADGHLYRMHTGDRTKDNGVEGLGVKSVEWMPNSDFLAVGGWDKRITLLSTRTYSPAVYLDHTPTIHLPAGNVFNEVVPASSERSYAYAAQPLTPPAAATLPSDPTPKQGISLISFSADSTLVATRDDSAPTTIWLWDLTQLSPKMVLIQHAPVKQLTWHPAIPSLLLIQCAQDEPISYIWTSPSTSSSSSSLDSPPEVLPFNSKIIKPAGSAPVKWDAKWLCTPADKKPALLFGHQQGYILVWPDGRDPILKFEKEDGGSESEDSLYDILTGRTPVPRLEDSGRFDGSEVDDSTGGALEDTFREKRDRAGEQRQDEVFDESGMSEMF